MFKHRKSPKHVRTRVPVGTLGHSCLYIQGWAQGQKPENYAESPRALSFSTGCGK